MDPLDFLDPIAAAAYRRAAMSQQNAAGPRGDTPLAGVPEEEKSSFLAKMLDSSLGGLSYVGKFLDKTFGGRAIRGVLGGKPEEALSILPFSDSLGITKEENTVQGTDLLRHYGISSGGEDWQNQLAGFGAEVLTDPSSYLGIGTLTKAGQATAKAGGRLAPTLAGRIGSGEAALASVGLPLGKTLFGLEPFLMGTGKTGEALAENIPKAVGYLPKQAAYLAENYPGKLMERVTGINPVTAAGNLADSAYRFGRSQFDTRVLGAFTRAGQETAEHAISPEYQTLLNTGRKRFADAAVDLEKIRQDSGEAAYTAAEKYLVSKVETPTDWDKNVVERVRKWQADGVDPQIIAMNEADLRLINREAQNWAATNGTSKWAQYLTPDQVKALDTHAADASQLFDDIRLAGRQLGFNSPDNMDLLEYMTRQRNAVPQQAGENPWAYARRVTAEFNARNKYQGKRLDAFHDLPGGTLQLNELIKDPRLSGPNRTLTDQQVVDELGQTLFGRPLARVGLAGQKWASDLGATLKNMEPYWSESNRDFFKLDFAGNRLSRETAQARNAGAAMGAYHAVEKYAATAGSFKPGEGVPVTKVFEAMGLDARAAGSSAPTSWNIAAQRLGLPNVDDVKNIALPTDLANDLVKMGAAWRNPKEMVPILQAWDMMSNLFKTGVTTLFPSFHVRNAFSGLFNAWRDDAFSVTSVKNMQDVLRGGHLPDEVVSRLYPGMTRGEATLAFNKELVAQRIAYNRNVRSVDIAGPNADSYALHLPNLSGNRSSLGDVGRNFLGTLGPTDTKWETLRREYLSPGLIQGVNADEDINRFVKAGRAVGTTIEDTIRGSHYLEKRLAGFTPEVARDSVMKYHIDYGNLTQAEKNIYRRIFPWYNFTSRNLPPLLEDLAEHPGKITAAMRLISGVRDPQQFAPAYLAEGASIPIGTGENGFQRYITSFGLPLEDEGVKTIGSILRGDIGRFSQQVLGMTNPMVKALPEQAFGTQLFSGRKLEDLRPSQVSSLGGILPDQTARFFDQFIANSPASRIVHSGETLIDPRKDALAALVNLGTGVKVSDVDTGRQQNIAARELVKTLLRPSQEARVREEVYVPKDLYPQLDPSERFLVDLLRETNQRVIDQQKAEKAASH